MKIKTIGNLAGWLGMILIQLATIPTTVKILLGQTSAMPPVDMVLLVWLGLFLFLMRSVVNKETLYIISNSTGFFFQSILLYLLVSR